MDFLWLYAPFTFAFAMGFGMEDPAAAAAINERLLPYRSLHAAAGCCSYFSPIEVALAITARAMGDLEASLAHHEAAAAIIETCGAARARALNDYQQARTLLVRDASGDRERAAEILEETLAYCRSRGYGFFVAKCEELLATIR
jgi:hypothetical protein